TDRAGILSGGNFHGEPLALPLEYAQGALAELATISERRLDRVLNPLVQEGHLPAFLASEPGVESGYMLAQYTSAAVATEARSLGRPSLDNVTVSGNQEDHVSMSAESALRALETLEAVRRAIAAELLCGVEASRHLPVELELGEGTAAVAAAVEDAVPRIEGDHPVGPRLEAVAELIDDGGLEEAIEVALGAPLEATRLPARAGAYR
ncbi:MAG: aromatic amino acid lyase, partial [Halobacteriota archaeon]